MIKVIIFDLDDTLIDTSFLKPMRDKGEWLKIRKQLNHCNLFEDTIGVLNTARSLGIKVAIFTNSPSKYAQDLLNFFNVSVDYLIAYHDVKQHKPDREGVDKILNYFSVDASEAIYIGDSQQDRESAEHAGVDFYLVDWGYALDLDESRIGISHITELIGNGGFNSLKSEYRSQLLNEGNHLFLGYYLDGIKKELFSFKDGIESSIQRWVSKSIELSDAFPDINVVVRALGHSELKTSNSLTPLDKLSLNLANSLGADFKPGLIKKKFKLEKSTKLGAIERRKQIKGAYKAQADSKLQNASELSILIVDDVLTSGATTNEISRAIEEVYPNANIYIFTLIKTLYRLESTNLGIEHQHNIQLFSNLYNSKILEKPSSNKKSINDQIRASYKRSLISKCYSANYANTNHNFIFQNLQPSTIASNSKFKTLFSAIQVLKNILQRGKPTIASRKLRKAFGIDICDSGLELPSQPLISKKPVNWRRLIKGHESSGINHAKYFFDELVPKYFGEYGFVKQLIVPEVQIFDMTQVYVEQFQNRQVDFYIPQVGIIIEIDGVQHRDSQEADIKRDSFTESLGLKTIRFTSQEIRSEDSAFLEKMVELCNYIKRIDLLEQKGIINPPNKIKLQDYRKTYSEGIDQESSSVRLTAAIRFQILLLELLERGNLKLGQTNRIILINRDNIDFAKDAVNDLNELLSNILQLLDSSLELLSLDIKELKELPENRKDSELIIDFSILERYDDSFQVNQDVIYSRTHYFDFYRYFTDRDVAAIESVSLKDYDYFQLSCTDTIGYKLDLSPNSEQRESLRYFLSNLFLPFMDEVDFREGQVGIIGSALSKNGTIGLLPTGSGKSICYQLSAILQPAVSFVVCPIKSLMYDQKYDLDSIGFTRTNYITSDLKADEKKQVQQEFGRGKYFFIFISPERFQTLNFRNEMTAIGHDHNFSYAVIDEAHCLSEWGHDFRTSYLNLANTIEKFAPGSNYIGLTATASVNVLKDIQTEFNISNDFVRTPMDFTREELSFDVINDLGNKQNAAFKLLQKLDTKWNENETIEDSKAGIIFTSTVNGAKGCFDLANSLSSYLDIDVRYYSGSLPKNAKLHGESYDEYKRKVQDDFKLNKFKLLTATKAFGMGVNKGNIAFTIHYGIPSSMEALYQEAGRAGREKHLFKDNPADCFVLLTKEQNTKLLDNIWDSSTSVVDLKQCVKQLNRNSDVNTNLFLMTASLDTINDEFKLIYSIYNFLLNCIDRESISITASQFNTNKFKFEKAIYRMSQLGIVFDWVVEDFFDGRLLIYFKIPSEEQLENNMENTIRKYEPEFKLEEVFESESQYYQIICQKFHRGSIDRPQFIFLILLLWSYDHFVYNRRQSLKTVYEQCSELSDGKISRKDFKDRLEGYFKFNESSHKLLNLIEHSSDSKQWLSVFYEHSENNENPKIIDDKALLTLREQISRFLESYKNNDCLNYLSGIVRLMIDKFDDADGKRRMSSSLNNLIANNKDEALSVVRQTLNLKPLFSIESQCHFAKLVDEKFESYDVLKEINDEFNDPYTYHQILTPLVSRLSEVVKQYNKVNWL